MCKIFIIAGIKPESSNAAVALTKKMGELMSSGNSDGLGYAAVDKAGTLFAERWLTNKDAFRQDNAKELVVHSMFSKALKGSPSAMGEYSAHGTPNLSSAVAITLHTRFATSAKGLVNTHPFIDADTSLIHNGVISNVSDFKFTLSSCDSEAILISYLKNAVGKDIDGVGAMAKSLQGYYACGMFARDNTGARVLDIFKGRNNNLVMCYIYELSTWIMSSAQSDITEACKALGLRHGEFFDVHDGHILRINPIDGRVVTSREFDVTQQTFPQTGGYYGGYDDEYYDHSRGASEYNWRNGRAAPMVIEDEEKNYLSLLPSVSRMNDEEKALCLTPLGLAL